MSLLIEHASQPPAAKTANPFAPTSDWRALINDERARLREHRDAQARQMRERVERFILRRARRNPHLLPHELVHAARRRFGVLGQGVVSDSSVAYLLKQYRSAAMRAPMHAPATCLNSGTSESHQKERHPPAPPATARGETVWQGWYPVGNYATFLFHVHVTVDLFDGFTTGQVFCGATPDIVVELLSQHTLPKYEEEGVRIQTLMTNGACAYLGSGKGKRIYGDFLRAHGIAHRVAAHQEALQGETPRCRQTMLTDFVSDWRDHLKTVDKAGRRLRADGDAAAARAKLLEIRGAFATLLAECNEQCLRG